MGPFGSSYALLPESDEPPERFRLFSYGVNESSKGPAVFDERSAETVMAAYAREGVDVMIDVEHDSLDRAARLARRDASEAVGWAALAVVDRELWAVNVRWNSCGQDQLKHKKRRYTSPAFEVDESGRVVRLVNIALTGMPATYDAAPLVAASRSETSEMNIDPGLIQKAIDALTAGDGKAALEILSAMLVSAAGGDTEPEEPPVDDPSAGAPDVAGMALSELAGVLGVSDPGAMLERVKALAAADAAATRSRLALEEGARTELVGRLVQLRAETPTTAWQGGKLVDRLASEPIDSLRARVVALSETAPPSPRAPKDKAPVGADDPFTAGMTDAQREKYLALRSRRAK